MGWAATLPVAETTRTSSRALLGRARAKALSAAGSLVPCTYPVQPAMVLVNCTAHAVACTGKLLVMPMLLNSCQAFGALG